MSDTKRPRDDSADALAATPSKMPKVEEEESKVDVKSAMDAAAGIAARLAAQYAPKMGSSSGPYVPGGREAGDPDHVKDIEINDLRNRYVLTKGTTQAQILADTGALVITKGVWVPDRADPIGTPLYLHITADTAEQLEAGIKAVQELIDQELGPLIDQNRFRDRNEPRERRKWPEEKVFIEIEAMRNFNVRAKVVGPGGLFVKYIQGETQTRVQIKGIGSGFIETDTGREGDDAMHIHVTGPDQVMVDKATEMAKDLLVVVKEEHAKAKSAGDQGYGQQQGGYGQQQGGYGQQQGGYGQQQQQGYGQQQGYQQQQYAQGVTAPLPTGDAPPPPPSAPSNGAIPPQAAGGTATPEEWAAYWNSLDEGGKAYYMQYYASGAAYAQPAQPAAPSSAPPPPPPSDGPKGGSGTYGAVPPPSGL